MRIIKGPLSFPDLLIYIYSHIFEKSLVIITIKTLVLYNIDNEYQ